MALEKIADALTNTKTKDMALKMTLTPVGEIKEKITSMLRAAPGRMMTLRQIGNTMSKNQRAKFRLAVVVDEMEKDGQVLQINKGSSGQKGNFVKLI
jgi:hypothetical protein